MQCKDDEIFSRLSARAQSIIQAVLRAYGLGFNVCIGFIRFYRVLAGTPEVVWLLDACMEVVLKMT